MNNSTATTAPVADYLAHLPLSAQEREQLVEAGVETVADVLALREQIRQASNAAELAVSTLTEVSAVQAFTW